MRFLFVDSILELEGGKRILATKAITAMDEYLTAHYPRRPVVPPTLVLESLAQTGGWLNLISRDFKVKTILVLIEGVRVHRQVRLGDTLFLEVQLLYAHSDGVTVRGEARVDSELVVTVDRIIFAHEVTSEESFAEESRERFRYLSSRLSALKESKR